MEKKKTNVMAIVGLVVSIVASGLVGLILSIIGLNEAKKTNEGRGIAIAGIVIGALRMVFVIVVFVFAIVFQGMVWTNVKHEVTTNTYCAAAFNCTCEGDTCDCTYLDAYGNQNSIQCPNE